MKGSVRLAVLMALAALFAIAPIVAAGPAADGQAFAQEPSTNLPITAPVARVVNQTATCVTGPLSCHKATYDSDIYDVVAPVDASTLTDFGANLAQKSILVDVRVGTCSSATQHLLSSQWIAGNTIQKFGTGNRTVYSFDGDVSQTAHQEDAFDRFTMRLIINSANPAQSALRLRANANLCDWVDVVYGSATKPTPVTGPITLTIIAVNFSTGESEQACASLTPTYSNLDVTLAYCP